GLQHTFCPCVKLAWDSAEVTLEPQLPLSLSSKDLGPWPLPFYPKLGEPSFNWELLSSLPCWLLRWVYLENEVLPRAQSTPEPRATVGHLLVASAGS
uniref:Uncharacterized protein n=1 Tax=Panthera leo TaxID=9689 RepID=A0A8C8WBL5_PANLE